MTFTLTSTAFSHNGEIPTKHTCDGKDVSPPLEWSDPPARTKTFALICDDPDAPAGTWVHWVLYNISESERSLPEGVTAGTKFRDGRLQGVNDFKRTGYGGPCPPPGPAHRYFFKLYALDTPLELQPDASKKDVESAMKGHVLAEAQLMGRYQRKKR